jgi:hypothetical protein
MKYYKSLSTNQSSCLVTWDNTLNGLNHNQMCILFTCYLNVESQWNVYFDPHGIYGCYKMNYFSEYQDSKACSKSIIKHFM